MGKPAMAIICGVLSLPDTWLPGENVLVVAWLPPHVNAARGLPFEENTRPDINLPPA